MMLHERLTDKPIIESVVPLNYITCKVCHEDATLGHVYLKNNTGPYCPGCFAALVKLAEEQLGYEEEEDE